MAAILELRDLVVSAGPGAGRARLSLAYDRAAFTVVPAGPGLARAFARTVAGLARPVSGRVLVGERDVTDVPPGSRQMGYVPAGGALLPHLTVRENIEYLLWRRDTVRDLILGWEKVVVDRLELGPVLDQRPHEITAWQRLLGALARAVVSLPEVVVFDRPDTGAVGRLRALLARLETAEAAGPSTVAFTVGEVPAGDADRVVRAVAVIEP
ncbi:ATP-binding cassette domain-containing protein [Planosporangium sp. 12N6]|uniref:ATP-binding cassette domain-containing protein n=1 Tax=Planosporangium spinosum TaxID=3402278 RepID=UPI003CF93C29